MTPQRSDGRPAGADGPTRPQPDGRPRVLSFPHVLSETSNPYVGILEQGLDDLGIAYDAYRPFTLFQSADVFHLHWLERPYQMRLGWRSPVFSAYIFWNLYRTMKRIRQRGGRVVWTAHNLKPHEPPPGGHRRVFDFWKDRILGEVDCVICMYEGAVDLVKQAYPVLERTPFQIARHPHYRHVFGRWTDRRTTRERLGLPEDGFVVSMLGYIRPYKGIAEAIQLFRTVAEPNSYLVIAGLCRDQSYRAALEIATGDAKNVICQYQALSDEELASLSKASDLALFNFSSILNSGSVLAALSLDVPVLAPRQNGIVDLARRTGPAWTQLFEAPLDCATLRRAMDEMRSNPPQGRPNLAAFEPDRVARQHAEAFGLDVSPALGHAA